MTASSPSTSRRFPGFDKVYDLSDPMARQPYRGEMKVRHPEQFSFTRCESRPKKAVTIRHDMGEAMPKDAFWTSAVAPLIVSQRFVNVLAENRFTGWDTYPVKVHAKGGELVPGYCGLCIYGRCGPTQWARSEVIYKDYPGGRFPCYKGQYFDPDTWDGSDLFMETAFTGVMYALEPVTSQRNLPALPSRGAGPRVSGRARLSPVSTRNTGPPGQSHLPGARLASTPSKAIDDLLPHAESSSVWSGYPALDFLSNTALVSW